MAPESRVGIVMPARNERKTLESGFLNHVLEHVPKSCEPTLYLSVSNADDSFIEIARNLVNREPRIKLINLGNPDPRGLAYAYLYGLKQAVSDENGKIIEMDANGSHNPEYIPEFLGRLDHSAVALSTRFSHGGRIDRYPLQRKLISAGGTILANLVLGLGKIVPDMTSGYEAFRQEVLKDIFAKQPIEDWVSVVHGPGHFYQTEIRARVMWRNHSYVMVPIIWGTDRMIDPVNLPAKEVLKALKSLFILRRMKESLK